MVHEKRFRIYPVVFGLSRIRDYHVRHLPIQKDLQIKAHMKLQTLSTILHNTKVRNENRNFHNKLHSI